MPTLTKFQQFIEDLHKGVHNFTSDSTCTPTLALTTNANAPNVATHTVKANLTEIAYTNLSSRVITGISAEQTSGTVKLLATDLVLTASGGTVGPFRHIPIFNDDPTSPADPLIGTYDYGADLTLNDTETLTVDFDGTNGIWTAS
jgi:hypothetical protein